MPTGVKWETADPAEGLLSSASLSGWDVCLI